MSKKIIVVMCFISIQNLFGQNLKIEISSAFGIDSIYLNDKKIDLKIISDTIGVSYLQAPKLFEGEVLSLYSKNRIYSVTLPPNCTNLENHQENNLEVKFAKNQMITGRLNGRSKISAMPLHTYTLNGSLLIDESYGILVK